MTSTFMRWVNAAAIVGGLTGSAMGAGTFFDDFDQYANQTALNGGSWAQSSGAFTTGTLSTTHALGRQALQCQQTPTESRPKRLLRTKDTVPVPDPGRLDLWFYDDAADIKAFDITVANGATKASIGLRDNQVGTATNYMCDLNGTLTDTGIERSQGWHLAQFAVHLTNGTKMQIDKQNWVGNTVAALTAANDLTIYSNLGAPTDANLLWIDSVRWIGEDSAAVLPADATVEFIEHFDTGINGWSPSAGTIEADVHYVNDYGSDNTSACIDVFDTGGARGFQGLLGSAVRINGKYRLGFEYQNNPGGPAGWLPWTNLTVAMNGTSTVNLGSDQKQVWTYGETAGTVNLFEDTDVSIAVTGGSTATTGYVRFDNFELILSDFLAAPTGAKDWQLY